MHAFYAENFDREVVCTEKQWLGCLPHALGYHPYQIVARALTARIGAGGQLALSWRSIEPRKTAPARTALLLVSFRFTGLDDGQRYSFMKRFDLHLQAMER